MLARFSVDICIIIEKKQSGSLHSSSSERRLHLHMRLYRRNAYMRDALHATVHLIYDPYLEVCMIALLDYDC